MDSVSAIAPTFAAVDYVIFALFLAISSAVGIFFSHRGKATTGEYFLGNRQMHPIPVGLSTGVSFLSSALLVGMPAEIYINGYQYVLIVVTGAVGFFLASCLVVHILFANNLTSLHDYFSRRYGSPVIHVGANMLVLICIFEYMGVCMLGSVIALNSVTGGQISVEVALVIGGAVGIFYTSIGGLKAVVWTDVIQSVIMIMGVVVVMVKSTVDTPGGVAGVVRTSYRFGRIHVPEVSPDPTIRHTIWGLLIGNFFSWAVWSAQPANVQRLCATSGPSEARIISGIASLIFVVFTILPAWCGLSIFSYYTERGCDVFAAGWIKENEIILYYIREQLNWPGFQGLFMAALYAGSLSSLSSGLNAASAILWKDLLKVYIFPDVSERRATLVSKLLVVIFGVLSMIWSYALFSIGGLILQLASSIDGAIYSAYFTVFLVAICCRWVEWKGTLVGLLFGFTFTLILGVGSLLNGNVQVTQLPTVTDRCANNATGNWTSFSRPSAANETATAATSIFSISYQWLSIICLVLTLLTAMLVSLCTGPARDVEPSLLLSCCRGRRGDGVEGDSEEFVPMNEAGKA